MRVYRRAFTNFLRICALRSPVIHAATGGRVKSADFVNMLGDDGQPRLFTRTIMRRKLGKIAKGKAPGFSGNGPDLYASLPDEWRVARLGGQIG